MSGYFENVYLNQAGDIGSVFSNKWFKCRWGKNRKHFIVFNVIDMFKTGEKEAQQSHGSEHTKKIVE